MIRKQYYPPLDYFLDPDLITSLEISSKIPKENIPKGFRSYKWLLTVESGVKVVVLS